MTDSSPRDPNDSVSVWIRDIQTGDEESITRLWNHCFPQLMAYARTKLPPRLRATLDEEDVALSTFKSFCIRARDQSLGEIDGRDGMWRLLHCIAARKANQQIRHLSRKKRGGMGEETATPPGDETGPSQKPWTAQPLESFATPGMTPDAEVLFADQCRHLLEMLDDDVLETIALLRMEGYSVAEIAIKIGCARRSVERRLGMIRSIWEAS